ncbi:MAG TPA: hypothetical protein PKM31_10725, partial [Bacillota bacterium]|nr:hypothetical protein [Bacillota bacterium]
RNSETAPAGPVDGSQSRERRVCQAPAAPLGPMPAAWRGAGICSEQISSCTMGVLGTGGTFIMHANLWFLARQEAIRTYENTSK